MQSVQNEKLNDKLWKLKLGELEADRCAYPKIRFPENNTMVVMIS